MTIPPPPSVPREYTTPLPRALARQVLATVVAAGLVGVGSGALTAWVSVRDTAQELEHVREVHRDDMREQAAMISTEIAARQTWQQHHIEAGHPDVVDALRSIDRSLAKLDAQMDALQQRLDRQERRGR